MKKKKKKTFQTKKGFITCSKLMINEITRSPTRSKNIYFVNNEQALIAVFIAVLICLNLDYIIIDQRKQCAMWNSKKPMKFEHL